MEECAFYGTKAVSVSGKSSLVIYFDKCWGLKPNDLVDINIYRMGDSQRIISVTKKVSRIGGSVGIFIDKKWNFPCGSLVVFKVVKKGELVAAGSDA